jgi:hypothetical protein
MHGLGPLMAAVKRELDQSVAVRVLENRKTMLHAHLLKGVVGRSVTLKSYEALAEGLQIDLGETLAKQRRLVAKRRWQMIRRQMHVKRAQSRARADERALQHHLERRNQLMARIGVDVGTDPERLAATLAARKEELEAAIANTAAFVSTVSHEALQRRLKVLEAQVVVG